jgi:hypothetical protein
MFSADEKATSAASASPLTEVSAVEASSTDPAASVMASAAAASSSSSSSASPELGEVKAVYLDMNTGKETEVKWVDPAMAANSNLLDNLSWGYFFLVFPFTLLLDDVFHFLPRDGPLSFLSNFSH